MGKMIKKPLIIAVETSSRVGSVAVAFGEQFVKQTAFSGVMRHSAELFPSIKSLLYSIDRKPHEIEHLYISIGPGSFTGLRIAVTLAKAMHLANQIKIVAVDALDVIAANVADFIKEGEGEIHGSNSSKRPIRKFATILDAKRGQFFISIYNRVHKAIDVQNEKVVPDSLMTASQFLDQYNCSRSPIGLLGDGLVYHKDKFQAEGVFFLSEKYWSPQASKVHLLGWKMAQKDRFSKPVDLKPFYLCRPDIKIKTC
jgi:tRNA threonylcarbamoyladenosine biosynthesis protein TsaB